MIGMSTDWRRSVTWMLKVNVIFLVIDIALLLLLSQFFRVAVFSLVHSGFFSMLLLLDSGIIFLMGGIIAMSSSIFPSKVREYVFRSHETWSQERHRKSERKANLYILMGILLFLESVVLGFIV